MAKMEERGESQPGQVENSTASMTEGILFSAPVNLKASTKNRLINAQRIQFNRIHELKEVLPHSGVYVLCTTCSKPSLDLLECRHSFKCAPWEISSLPFPNTTKLCTVYITSAQPVALGVPAQR